MVKITTETGSEYVLDLEHKLWERTNSSGESGALRTISGSFYSAEYSVGGRLNMMMPALVAHATARLVSTSLVTKVEEM